MSSVAISNLVLQRSEFLRFVQRRVGSRDTAEDILQAAYVRAVEQATHIRNDESASAWFYRILRNAVIDHYRHRTAEDHALARWAQDLESSTAPDPKTSEIVCGCIAKIIPTLKPSYREILHEVELAGATLDTFAKSAGITPANAAVRVHRARQALKKQLMLVCGCCSTHGCINCTCASA
ncbi:hypothetical protein GCM10011507_06440 [Edaphobacter acidisoli]|uniref:RNA polymerase sigma-70 region 2 domain-containing protein n=1 Tax=Edaphobacter acidisoli TaxID=2040573 RepID=A0A916RIY8_9BACT|nr:sigma-70 family RNA polymerase sigma factor [Edaphobacter acidisoli]GGA57798.1 hypothetical protein GCM10011507_06440 [Edaphobacter acidisoli]